MFHLLRFFFRPIGFVMLSIAMLGLAAYGLLADPDSVPAPGDLKVTIGRVVSAKKITSKHDSVKYELEVKDDGGAGSTFRIRQSQISDDAIRSIIDEKVTIKAVDSSDVWELTSGTASIITYEATKARALERQHELKDDAPYIGGTGMLLGLISVLWRRRRGSL